MIIIPLLKKSPLSGDLYITDYAYLMSESPCEETCLKEVDDLRFRPFDWEYNCPECSNHITFAYCHTYSELVGRYGRRIEEVSLFLQIHYFPRGKQGTNSSPRDLLLREIL